MKKFYIKKSSKVSGNYTVELALVLPIVFIIILAIIIYALYLHDVCKIQGVVNRTLYRSDEIIDMEEYLLQQLDGNLFVTDITYVDGKKQGGKVSLFLEAESKGTLLEGSGFLPKNRIKIQESSPVHKPADTIRMVSVILDTGSKIKLKVE